MIFLTRHCSVSGGDSTLESTWKQDLLQMCHCVGGERLKADSKKPFSAVPCFCFRGHSAGSIWVWQCCSVRIPELSIHCDLTYLTACTKNSPSFLSGKKNWFFFSSLGKYREACVSGSWRDWKLWSVWKLWPKTFILGMLWPKVFYVFLLFPLIT